MSEDRSMKAEDILTPQQLAERLQVGVSWVYEKSRHRGSTLKNLCLFSGVAAICGSAGQMFANGCEVEPTSEQQPRERLVDPLGKNEADPLQFPLQSGNSLVAAPSHAASK